MWDKDELLEEIKNGHHILLEMDKEDLAEQEANGGDPATIQMLRDQIKWAEDMLKHM